MSKASTIINACEAEVCDRLAMARTFLKPKQVMVAIGLDADNGSYGAWESGRVMGVGAYIAMCRISGDDGRDQFGRMMRSIVVSDARTLLSMPQIFERLEAVRAGLADAMVLLRPVAAFRDPPRVGRPQVAHALERIIDGADELRGLAGSLEAIQPRRRAREMETIDST